MRHRFNSVLVGLFACLALALTLASAAPAAPAPRPPVILAAASLQESLTAAADAWVAKRHSRPILSFAGSPALARQIEAGSPADMFISADEAWMDDLALKSLIQPKTRVAFLGNALVLVAPKASGLRITMGKKLRLAQALGKGRLAMADPDSVPAGRYGKESLTWLGVWQEVEPKVVRTDNVRSALLLVERGEAAAGIVYATDARASKLVRIVAVFPASSHTRISYPMALLKTATSKDAEPFRKFLLSREGKAIFSRYGFVPR